MTIAEQWEQEGFLKGLEQSMHILLGELREESVRRGGAMILERLLQKRFGLIPAKYVIELECARMATLLQWSDRVFDAVTLEEVFG